MNEEPRIAVSRVSNIGLAAVVGAAGLFDAFRRREGLMRVVSLAGAAFAASAASTVRVVADANGLHVGFGPWGWPTRHIRRDRIAGVRVEDANVWHFGGWGYRIRGKDSRVIVRSGPTLVVDLVGAGSFGVTIPDAEAFANVLSAVTPH